MSGLRGSRFPEIKFKCKYCGRVFLTARQLVVHKQEQHQHLLPQSVGPLSSSAFHSQPSSSFLDPVPGLLPPQPLRGLQPVKSLKKPQIGRKVPIHRCKFCLECFANLMELDQHEQEHLPPDELTKCQHCHEEMPERILQLHEEHCPAATKRADVANERSTSSGLSGEETEGIEIKVACRYCDRLFRKNHIRRHERTHTGERPYSCKMCKREFSQSGNMKKHESICRGRRSSSLGILSPPRSAIKSRSYTSDQEGRDPKTWSRSRSVLGGRSPSPVDGNGPGFQRFRNRDDSCMKTVSSESDRFRRTVSICPYCMEVFKSQDHCVQHQKLCSARFDALYQGHHLRNPSVSSHSGVQEGRSFNYEDKLENVPRRWQRPGCLNQQSSSEVTHSVFNEEEDCDDDDESMVSSDNSDEPPMLAIAAPPESSQYCCKYCGEEFSSLLKVENHERIHTEEPPSSSKHCAVEATRPSSADSPVTEKRVIPTDRTVPSMNAAKKKLSTLKSTPNKATAFYVKPVRVEGELFYSCSICAKTFSSIPLCRIHGKIHTGRKPFGCDKCPLSFNNPDALRYHMAKCKKALGSNHPKKVNQALATSQEETCEDHLPPVKGPGRACTPGVAPKRDAAAETHMEPEPFVLHWNRIMVGVKIVGFSCNLCQKTVQHLVQIKNHVMEHVGPSIYSCPHCDETFKTYPEVTSHQKLHGLPEPLKKRGRPPTFIPELDVHFTEIRGSNGSLFTCKLCPWTSPRKFPMREHIMKHVGLLPFKCTICNERFSNAQGLKSHTEQHKKERPHRCRICPLGFSNQDELWNHMDGHTSLKPFLCMTCGEWFRSGWDLKMHLKKH